MLREAARQVGVSATAAYRHFAGHGELMHAVKMQAASQLAASMRIELTKTPPAPNPQDEARRRLRALGLGYLHFALAEPGLFRTVFCRTTAPNRADSEPAPSYDDDLALADPYQMLMECIDAYLTAGLLSFERRPWAETFAWASVHGLAMLLLDGPLRHCQPMERETIIERVLDGVRAGLESA